MQERTTPLSPTRSPLAYESLTNLYGYVYAVFSTLDGSYVTITRYVDWLSPQLVIAMASKKSFRVVNVHTPSGKTLNIGTSEVVATCGIVAVTKAGLWPPAVGPVAGAGPVSPDMEAITWTCSGAVWVDGLEYILNAYNWAGLNVWA